MSGDAKQRSALVEWVSTHLIQCVLAMFGLLCSFAAAAIPWMYRTGIDVAVTKVEVLQLGKDVNRLEQSVERIRDRGPQQQQAIKFGTDFEELVREGRDKLLTEWMSHEPVPTTDADLRNEAGDVRDAHVGVRDPHTAGADELGDGPAGAN